MIVEVTAEAIRHIKLRVEADSYIEAYDTARKYIYNNGDTDDVLITSAVRVKKSQEESK